MRKFNIFTVFFIAMVSMLTLLPSAASALDDPGIKADAALLVEAGTGQVLYEKDMEAHTAPGSIAKVMTLLLAVEAVENGEVKSDELVTASASAISAANKSTPVQNIAVGETLPFQDLLYCAYLADAGDAANIIAERVGGSVASFTEKMNDRASALGCTDTHFTNPIGAAGKGQYTTAWDQYLIFREAIGHQLFTKIAGAARYQTEASGVSPVRFIENSNQMLNENSRYYYKYCLGGKTAAADGSKNNFISYAKNNDMTLISVVFGADVNQAADGSMEIMSLTDTKRLFEWGFTGYAWRTLASKNEIVTSVPVAQAEDGGSVGLCPLETVAVLLPANIPDSDIKENIVIYGSEEGNQPTAPVREGDILGEMTVLVDGTERGKTKLVASRDIALDKGRYIKSEITKTLSNHWVQLGICVTALLIIGYIILVVRDMKKRRDRKRMIAATKKRLIEERKKLAIREKPLAEESRHIDTEDFTAVRTDIGLPEEKSAFDEKKILENIKIIEAKKIEETRRFLESQKASAPAKKPAEEPGHAR